MDLSQLDTKKAADEGAFLQLRHPVTNELLVDKDDDNKPIGLTLLGSDSEAYRSSSLFRSNRRLKEAMKKGDKANLSVESIDNDKLDCLAACTIKFHQIAVDGKQRQCSADEAKKLYTRFTWIREQAEQFIDDRGNYLGNSSQSSS